jgi:hypothetical protein
MTVPGEGIPQGIEKIKPVVLRPQPDISLPVLPYRNDGVPTTIGDRRIGYRREQPRLGMKDIQPRLRAHPDLPGPVFQQTIDPVIPQRTRTPTHPVMPELPRPFIELIHAPGGRNPKLSFMVLQKRSDPAVAQTSIVAIPVLPLREPVLHPVEPV